MEISVIIPMYNEEENVERTLGQVTRAMEGYVNWELVVVDDGSTDRTLEIASRLAADDRHTLVIPHATNYGRGRALRTGFAYAQGDILVTLDADLSYTPDHIPELIKELEKDQSLDIVVGSPYLKEGKVVGVPAHRLLLSKMGNRLLGFSLPGRLKTVTGILRAYRRRVFDELELGSDDKEIHLEILAKALALGHNVKEVPAQLKARQKGKSKLKLRPTILSHLMFSFYEKPAMLFGAVGLLMTLAGLFLGGYLFYVWLKGELNPERPLMPVTVTLIVAGIQIFFFGFVATQIVSLKREIYKVQKNNSKTRKSAAAMSRNDDDSLPVVATGRRELE